jgi:hypothetical protein
MKQRPRIYYSETPKALMWEKSVIRMTASPCYRPVSVLGKPDQLSRQVGPRLVAPSCITVKLGQGGAAAL